MEQLFEQVESELLRKLFYFLTSKEVSKELEEFLSENCESFEGSIDDIVGEQNLERTEQYNAYCNLLETQLKRFCRDNETNIRLVFEECQNACEVSKKDEFNMASLLLDMLVAATDYQMFCVNCSTFKAFKLQRARLGKRAGESKFRDDSDSASSSGTESDASSDLEEEQKRFESKYESQGGTNRARTSHK